MLPLPAGSFYLHRHPAQLSSNSLLLLPLCPEEAAIVAYGPREASAKAHGTSAVGQDGRSSVAVLAYSGLKVLVWALFNPSIVQCSSENSVSI